MGHGPASQEIGDFGLENLAKAIRDALIKKYTGHWWPGKPIRGSGYRCIRVGNNAKTFEKVIAEAVHKTGLSLELVRKAFSTELFLWIDPGEISYKLGDQGSISVLWEKKEVETKENMETVNGQPLKPEVQNASTSKVGNITSSLTPDTDSGISASNSVEMEVINEGSQTGPEIPLNSVLNHTHKEQKKKEGNETRESTINGGTNSRTKS